VLQAHISCKLVDKAFQIYEEALEQNKITNTGNKEIAFMATMVAKTKNPQHMRRLFSFIEKYNLPVDASIVINFLNGCVSTDFAEDCHYYFQVAKKKLNFDIDRNVLYSYCRALETMELYSKVVTVCGKDEYSYEAMKFGEQPPIMDILIRSLLKAEPSEGIHLIKIMVFEERVEPEILTTNRALQYLEDNNRPADAAKIRAGLIVNARRRKKEEEEAEEENTE